MSLLPIGRPDGTTDPQSNKNGRRQVPCAQGSLGGASQPIGVSENNAFQNL